jgi:hypothetical protein
MGMKKFLHIVYNSISKGTSFERFMSHTAVKQPEYEM